MDTPRKVNVQHTRSLRGKSASAGTVRGKVCKIIDINKLDKMVEGTILVTKITNPMFVPVMKKAIAIITDEGGIFCHAAIIAREFGIPCIVGTKNATKLFSDGQEVEVDASKGIIKYKEFISL